MPTTKTLQFSLIGLILNIAYSSCHIILGLIIRSWWFFTIGIYYLILSIVRFAVLRTKKNDTKIIKLTAVMLIILSLPLIGIVILSFIKDRGTVFHEIVMITIALYSFTKITLASMNWIKSRRTYCAKSIALKNISFADALVSMFSLQRSMLVSFEGMSEANIRIMNTVVGAAVCITVFLLGWNLTRKLKNH